MSATLIRELQARVGVPADGVYGPATHAAVMALLARLPAAPQASADWVRRAQQRLKVPIDGVLGPATLAAMFRHMGALAPRADELGRAAARHLPAHQITANPDRLAEWFGEMAHETMGFQRFVEVMSYSSPERLMAVWPSRFPTRASALPYVRQPEKLANFVYANRMGNGPPESGDGWRYRGRGIIHLTGRANYREFGFEANPDAVAEPENAVRIAAGYWTRHGLNALADARQSDTISARINGKHPANGLADRRLRKAKMQEIFR